MYCIREESIFNKKQEKKTGGQGEKSTKVEPKGSWATFQPARGRPEGRGLGSRGGLGSSPAWSRSPDRWAWPRAVAADCIGWIHCKECLEAGSLLLLVLLFRMAGFTLLVSCG